MKKTLIRALALTLVLVLGLSMFSAAFAASASYKGTDSTSYTVTTGKKDATLKVSHSAGKITGTAWKNAIKRTSRQGRRPLATAGQNTNPEAID